MLAAASGPGVERNDSLIWVLPAAALLVFVVIYPALFAMLGVWTSLLFVLPLTGAALTWGLRGGLIAGLLSFPLNWSLAAWAGGGPPAVKPEHVLLAAAGILVAASIGAIRDSDVRHRRVIVELKQANERLIVALAQVKTMSGFVPICAGCGKMRNDEGTWLRIEEYMRGHSTLQFSHGLCPDCMVRLYPGTTIEEEGPPETGGAAR